MDPFVVLGVGRQASPKEIQRAYRRLALKFHPDRNPSPDAIRRFQEVQQAYELLNDPVRRQQYDMFGESLKPVAPTFTQTASTTAPTYDYGEKEMISRSAAFVRLFGLLFAVFSLVVLTDYILPPELVYDDVTEVERQGSTIMLFTAKGNSFGIEPIRLGYFRREPSLTVARSRILHILEEVRTNPSNYSAGTPGSFFGTFIFMPILWLILSTIQVLMWSKPRPRFYLMVVQVFFLISGLALLLTSRWNS